MILKALETGGRTPLPKNPLSGAMLLNCTTVLISQHPLKEKLHIPLVNNSSHKELPTLHITIEM